MTDTAITATGLSKRYKIGVNRDPYGRLTEVLWSSLTRPLRGKSVTQRSDEFWALRDVSFEVPRGSVVGVIGRNGAGKSTLLKILSRITEPTLGRAELHGRVGSLLEVGTGFHPELTGRENVLLSGAILGMKRAEINRKSAEILAFADIDQFIDTPVKRYSSGMKVRLGFAVAAFLETEILLVDEVLAVGDADFQKKCLGKMSDVARGGRTVVFVSHNLQAVSGLCDRAMLLDHGRLAFAGSTAATIGAYTELWAKQVEKGDGTFVYPEDTQAPAHLTRIRLLDKRGRPGLVHDLLEPVDVEIDFDLRRAFPTLLVCCEVRSGDGTLAYATQQSDWQNYVGPDKATQFPMKQGMYRATIHMPAPLLNAGAYELEVYLTTGPFRQDTRKGIMLEVVDDDSYVSYVTKTARGGVVTIPVRWDVRPRPTEETDVVADVAAAKATGNS
jgi:lipopolysaccharide transport system ATP-binding protein